MAAIIGTSLKDNKAIQFALTVAGRSFFALLMAALELHKLYRHGIMNE